MRPALADLEIRTRRNLVLVGAGWKPNALTPALTVEHEYVFTEIPIMEGNGMDP